MPEAVDAGRSALALEIIEAGEDGFLAFDERSRVVYVNRAASRLLGLEQAELAGRFQWEVFPATLGSQLRRAMAEGVAIGLSHYCEPERKWYEVRANPSGEGGLIVRFRDISEGKRAEEVLRESERRYKSLADNVPCVLMRYDRRLRVVDLSAKAGEITGIPADSFIGKTNREVGMPEHLCDLWENAIEQVFRTGANQDLEFEFPAPDGPRSFYLKLAPEFGPDGAVQHVLGISTDITERKRAEAALRESEERLSLAIEGAGMATWDVDLRTGDAVWSRRHFELLGYEPAPDGQATMEMWRSRVHPEDLEQVMAVFERAKSEHGLFCPEHRILRADNGQTVWLRVFGRFLYDEAGQAVRFIGVLFDNTAFREAARFIEAGKLAPPALLAATEPLRASGLEVIGALPWGTHLCQFYATGQDLAETLVPYFREGLAANEFCMWVTSAPLEVEQATAALRAAVPQLDDYLASGQMEILDYSQWYTKNGAFDADSVLQGWTDKLAEACKRGFEGLRLTGNTFWLEPADWDDFTRYEATVNAVIGSQRMLAICTYSLEKCGLREILDVVANHQFALIKRAGRWEVIEGAPAGQTELALRASQERLRLATWAAELGVFEWHVAADRTVWENPRMYEIFGRRQVEGPLNMAQLLEQAIHPDDVASFEAALAEGMNPGRLFHVVCRIRRANDGEWRWIEGSGCFERTPDGAPLRLAGVLGDITDRKRAEDALRQSEEDLNRAQAVAKTGSWRLDTRRDVLLWSDETHRMFGIPKGTPLTYEAFLAAVHPEDRECVDRNWTAALRGEPYNIEHRIIVGGDVKWVRERAELEFDREGTLLGGFGTVQDITERKQAEERIRHQNAVLEGISRIFRDALTCDREDELGRDCLAVAEEVTRSECGLIGVMNPEGRLDALASSGPGGEEVHGIGRRVLLDGKGFFTNDPATHSDSIGAPEKHQPLTALLGVPLIHAGKTIGMVGLGKRKGSYRPQDLEATEALAPAIVQVLVRTQAERALRAGEERLRQAQKMESIGLLAGGIAHDFNNLLATIMGNASLLEGEVREESHDKLAAVLRATERAADLTRQLLAYAGKGRFMVESLDLSRTVREMRDLLHASIPKKVELKLALDSRLPGIEADRGHLQQVVMNLVINAAEAIGASRSGTVRISTGAREISDTSRITDELTGGSPAPGKYVCLEVADTGCGMDKETRARIFDPFFTTKFMGRGLGLAAVAGIVQAHHGAIQLETAPGGGSTFRLFLPAGAAPHRRRRLGRQTDLLGCETILLVEDEVAVCDFVRAALERYGYKVLAARNGGDAVEMFGKQAARIGLVLLDLMMPVMGGDEAIGALQNKRADVKVIVMSGYSESEALKLFAGKGVSGFLQKPFTAARLAEEVKAVLTRAD